MATRSQRHALALVRSFFGLSVLSLLGTLVLSCANVGLKPDEAMAQMSVRDTQAAGDATVSLEGCGHQPIIGFTHCRFQEGAIPMGAIYIAVPPAQCRPEGASCVSWLIIRPDGSEFGGDIPRGQTRAAVPLPLLLGAASVGIGARGTYGVLLTVKWLDPEGHDRESRAEGEVHLRVVRTGYSPLHETPTSRSYVWEWVSDKAVYRMTTALRAYVGAR